MYFHDYKLAIDTNENGHSDRSMVWEIERQKAIEQGFVCKFIIIYPDKEDFGIFKTINYIFKHVKKSTKQLYK